MSLVCIFKKQLSVSTSIFAALLLELTYELEVLTQFCLLVEVHIVEYFCNLRGVELVLGFNLGGFNLNLRLLVLCLEQFSLTLQKDTLRLNLLC